MTEVSNLDSLLIVFSDAFRGCKTSGEGCPDLALASIFKDIHNETFCLRLRVRRKLTASNLSDSPISCDLTATASLGIFPKSNFCPKTEIRLTYLTNVSDLMSFNNDKHVDGAKMQGEALLSLAPKKGS